MSGSRSTLAFSMPSVASAWAATARWWLVTIVGTLARARWSSTARARAAPSSGFVLAPSSSNSTRERGPASPRMPITRRMWELNVDTLRSMLWWSPTSTYNASNMGRTVPSAAGT